MDSNDHTGSLLPIQRTRYCLQNHEGFIAGDTYISDPSSLFTKDPNNALQFVLWERAMTAASSVRHLHPGLEVREIRFQKINDSWRPV